MYADGYKYWFAFKTDKTSYYRCCRYIRTKCPGKCTNEDGRIKQHNSHNHPPESNRILVDKFRKILTHRACAENTELYTIYCDEATNRHCDAALLYPFTSAESAMRKARRKQLPRAPKSASELMDELNQTDLFRVKSGNDKDPLYQKTITLENSVCMIFLHRKTIDLFGRIDELHVDGSFEFVMENQPTYYLLTFHAIQGQINAPIVYTISTAKTQPSYSAIFAYIRDELKINPNTIISDYDIQMQSSLTYIYPETILKGCWFHYTDAVLSQMKNLSLKKETSRGNGASGLRMLLVLPLLPPEYMVPGLESVKKWLKEKTILSEGFRTLCDYIENCWLRGFGAEKMSIFGTTRIASNHLKNFNRELSDSIGQQNPVIWVILDSITQLATKIYVKTSRKMRNFKFNNNLQNITANSAVTNINGNTDQCNLNTTQTKQLSKCAPIINSFDLHNQQNSILPIPRTMKRSELVSETIITSATQLWIKTPVHLRNSLQFLQLISHCINDSMYLANLTDIKERNYLPTIASNCVLNSTIDRTKKKSLNNVNNCTGPTAGSLTETTIIQQSYILNNNNGAGNNNNNNNDNNNQIIEMIEDSTTTTTSHWNNHHHQLSDLQNSPSSPSLSFVLQEGTFNCTEITHQEYLLAQPGQAQQQNTYTSCFAQNNFDLNDLNNQNHQHQQQQSEIHLQVEQHNILHNDNQQQQNLFNFDDDQQQSQQPQHQQQQQQQQQEHLHHLLHQNTTISNSVQIRPMPQQQQQQQPTVQPTEPPPLVFFSSVKRLPCKRILPVLSEPPPLVPINSGKRSLITNKNN